MSRVNLQISFFDQALTSQVHLYVCSSRILEKHNHLESWTK